MAQQLSAPSSATQGPVSGTPQATAASSPAGSPPVAAKTFAGRDAQVIDDACFYKWPSTFIYKPNTVEKLLRREDLKGKEFVATEKIHGKNIGFFHRCSAETPDKDAVKAGDVRMASRNCFINKDKDPVDDADKVIGHYRENVRALGTLACEQGLCQPNDLLVVRGEYYGKQVQVGFSLPYIQPGFAAFAVEVNQKILPYDDARNLADQAGIPFVPELRRGTLEEVTALNPDDCISRLSAVTGESVAVEGVLYLSVDDSRFDFSKHQKNQLILFKHKASSYVEQVQSSREKGKNKGRKVAGAGAKKSDLICSQELVDAVREKLVIARISSLTSNQKIDLTAEWDEAFLTDLRKAIVQDAIETVEKNETSETLLDEFHKMKDCAAKREQLEKTLLRISKKNFSDEDVLKVLSDIDAGGN